MSILKNFLSLYIDEVIPSLKRISVTWSANLLFSDIRVIRQPFLFTFTIVPSPSNNALIRHAKSRVLHFIIFSGMVLNWPFSNKFLSKLLINSITFFDITLTAIWLFLVVMGASMLNISFMVER